MAEITNVSVRLFNKKNNNLKAFVQVELDSELVLTGIKLVKGNKGFFLGMPSQKWDSDEEYHDIYFPITGEFREELTEAVVDAYKQAKKEEEEDDAPKKKKSSKKSTSKKSSKSKKKYDDEEDDEEDE